jgi:hypothetical protein
LTREEDLKVSGLTEPVDPESEEMIPLPFRDNARELAEDLLALEGTSA